MDEFSLVFTTIWSLLGIVVGIIGVFFRKRFVDLNSGIFLTFYRWTGLIIFKQQAEEMVKPKFDTFIFVFGIAVLLISLGVFFRIL